MVELGINYEVARESLRLEGGISFREKNLWYPEVPDERLSFMGVESVQSSRTSYRPLTTALFGGQEGQYLPHIKRVKIWTTEGRPGHEKWRLPCIRGIQFLYDDSMEESQLMLLGQPLGESPERRVYHMDLDSRNGERIVQLDVFYVSRETSTLFRIRVRLSQ